MAAQTAAYAQPEGSTFEERAARSQALYWCARIREALDRLETEARRMFLLEVELGEFAQAYYEAVGDAAERLAQVEQQVALEIEEPVINPHNPAEHMAAMPAVLASRDAYAERRSEVKARYRMLAKEIHPDRAMVVEGAGRKASAMQTLNHAYQQGDLAALLRLEAEMFIDRIAQEHAGNTLPLEQALRELEQATNTYAEGYRNLLNSPLNELMLRAMSARLAGWDWIDAVVRKVERTIEEKQRAAVIANIEKIGAWREQPAA